MNAEKYDNAQKIIDGLNIWHDNKVHLSSVVARARRLEDEVEKKDKEIQMLCGRLNMISDIIEKGRTE